MLIETYSNFLVNVNGRGLLLGLKAIDSQTAFKIAKEMIQKGVLVFPAYGDTETLMIEPSLVITEKQIQKIIKELSIICSEMVS